MKYFTVCVMAIMLMLYATACGPADKKATGSYVSTYVEGSLEFVEVMLDDDTRKFVVRTSNEEYAAVPDFLKPGDRISISYRFDKGTGHYIITCISSSDDN